MKKINKNSSQGPNPSGNLGMALFSSQHLRGQSSQKLALERKENADGK